MGKSKIPVYCYECNRLIRHIEVTNPEKFPYATTLCDKCAKKRKERKNAK